MDRFKIKWWHIGLLAAIAVVFLSPLASSSPDGLEKVASDKGFEGRATSAPFTVIADYIFPGIHNEILATVMAGVIGTLLVFGVGYGLAYLLRQRRRV